MSREFYVVIERDEDKVLPEFVGVQKVMVNDQVTAS